MRSKTHRNLMHEASTYLQSLLGGSWRVIPEQHAASGDSGFDAVWTLHHTNQADAVSRLQIEVREHVSPLMVRQNAIQTLAERQAAHMDGGVLLVSSWLSPRTRALLDELGLNYLDLTGNASLQLDNPTLVVRTDGAQHNPEPPRQRRGLTGPRAARLVRELVDHQPPRRPRELARATGLSEGYVSRLLDVMAEEALLERKRSMITEVDWPALVRTRASNSELVNINEVVTTVPRMGIERVIDILATRKVRHQVLATGSFVASTDAPVAVGGALMLYTSPDPDAVDDLVRDLGLLRGEAGTDDGVLLLRPPNDDVFIRPRRELVRGVSCVGMSQLVLDCLSGPGRLPAQGEALLRRMRETESSWRHPSPLANQTVP